MSLKEKEKQVYEILKRYKELTLEEMKDLLRPILYYFDEDVFKTKEDLLLGFTRDC